MFTNNAFAEKFYNIQKSINPKSTIEIGAFDADFSKEMSKQLHNKNIWAIEANPKIYNKFKNSLDNINYLNFAVSDKNENININIINAPEDIDDWWQGASSILGRIDGIKTYTVEIKSVTLDSFVIDNNIAGPISLWIDVEGANKQVLSGGIETLKNVSSIYIETEIEPLWKDQWTINDVVYFLENNGFVLLDESSGLQRDLIFIKENITTSS